VFWSLYCWEDLWLQCFYTNALLDWDIPEPVYAAG
jgi:hypothetical protein